MGTRQYAKYKNGTKTRQLHFCSIWQTKSLLTSGKQRTFNSRIRDLLNSLSFICYLQDTCILGSKTDNLGYKIIFNRRKTVIIIQRTYKKKIRSKRFIFGRVLREIYDCIEKKQKWSFENFIWHCLDVRKLFFGWTYNGFMLLNLFG